MHVERLTHLKAETERQLSEEVSHQWATGKVVVMITSNQPKLDEKIDATLVCVQ